ncbi:STAS domain-containing protein [Rhodovulum sulfidophilum]|uniref:STAS domain-containing protein n=1 Tax=Rhodovulum sulfidophilum TaxID=35806 RepID=UPI00117A920F|nr:STAS domain-containing protein [Rhodovulum sulfidophilum]MBL3554278.1 STAS domain-containing protein [Rhodovulum sulfidophilum]
MPDIPPCPASTSSLLSSSSVPLPGRPILALSGPLTLDTLEDVRARLHRAGSAPRVDLSAVTELDTAGAWMLLGHRNLRIEAASPAQDLLLRTVEAALPPPRTVRPRKTRQRAGEALANVDAAPEGFLATSAQGLGFTGLVMARLATTLLRPQRLRLTALVHHMEEVGLPWSRQGPQCGLSCRLTRLLDLHYMRRGPREKGQIPIPPREQEGAAHLEGMPVPHTAPLNCRFGPPNGLSRMNSPPLQNSGLWQLKPGAGVFVAPAAVL